MSQIDATLSAARKFAARADNSVAGSMRDCGECHVGGGMMEYRLASVTGSGLPVGYTGANASAKSFQYDPANRIPLRDTTNKITDSIYSAFNYFIDIFNPGVKNGVDNAAKAAAASSVGLNNFADTGVMEMDCLMCHLKDYSWHERKEAVRKGQFDASRAIGAGLASPTALSGTTVTYDAIKVKDVGGFATIDLSTTMVSKPESKNCAACHMSEYNVDWKKRGEVYMNQNAARNGFEWLAGKDAHMAIGCMGCHERTGKAKFNNLSTAVIGTSGLMNNQLGLCDPAKGGASPFDAMWNSVDKAEFKDCSGCHSSTAADAPFKASGLNYNAPNAFAAHSSAGLTRRSAYTATGTAASHIEIMDCAACHIKKVGITGGAFVDGSGADEEGRVALHDNDYLARDMEDGVAVHWLGGKLHAANLLSSMFVRDVNGLKFGSGGLDANNDGREAGMDALLQTHINTINLANGKQALFTNGLVTPATVGTLLSNLGTGLPAQLALDPAIDIADSTGNHTFLGKLSFLMVPFKNSHNIQWARDAKGAGGCKDCHATNAGFYNGAYPINGNMAKNAAAGEAQYASGKKVVKAATDTNLTFGSGQVTAFTKVNGLVDVTDSHPNVMNKLNTRSVAIPILSAFDNPYTTAAAPGATTAFMRDIDRSEVLYETTFKTLNTDWSASAGTITGDPRPPITAGSSSPFYNANPSAAKKRGATSTLGWLLKIDTWDGTTYIAGKPAVAGNELVVSRSIQLTTDIAGSVDDIITNLGAGFCSNLNFEFDIVAADTKSWNATTKAFEAGTDGINDALKITAKSGKKIRISKQADAGPYGFANSLWVSAPITRTDADAVAFATANADTTNIAVAAGVASFKTRAGYVKYLDSIAAPPVADIATVTGYASVGTNVSVKTGVNIVFTGVDKGNPNFNYYWKFSNSATVADGRVVTMNFTSPVNVTATLFVKNTETGQVAAKKLLVFVTKTFDTTTDVTAAVATVDDKGININPGNNPRKVTLAISDMTLPVSKIQVLWGDGTSSSYKQTSTAYNASHTYYGAASTYSGKVKVISGATVKDEKPFRLDLRLTPNMIW